MEIHIKTIPDSMMRLPGGVGDYWYDREGVLQVRVVDMQNEFYEKMVVIHELIEESLTKKRGLSEPDIQAFDEYYEQRRAMGLVPEDSEPGFDENAPYVREHTLATSVEMQMCAMAGISWSEYDHYVMNL
jgi:hypothetical protein